MSDFSVSLMDFGRPATKHPVTALHMDDNQSAVGTCTAENDDLCSEKDENASTTEDIESEHLQDLSKTEEKESQEQEENSADNASIHSSMSGTSLKSRFPVRHGIIWRKNEKLEAMDFMKKWYTAKIVEIDEEEMTVLIHFEGWNQRYDEWVSMSSEKLRPKHRHSGRKYRSKRLSNEYRIGDHVYARWTDCKMYPGKVVHVSNDGAYDIEFYDGFRKVVQAINVRPMPEEVKKHAHKIEIVHIPTKDVKKRHSADSTEIKVVSPSEKTPPNPLMPAGKNVHGRRRSVPANIKLESVATENVEATPSGPGKSVSAKGKSTRKSLEGSGTRSRESSVESKKSEKLSEGRRKTKTSAKKRLSVSDSKASTSTAVPVTEELPEAAKDPDVPLQDTQITKAAGPVFEPLTSNSNVSSPASSVSGEKKGRRKTVSPVAPAAAETSVLAEIPVDTPTTEVTVSAPAPMPVPLPPSPLPSAPTPSRGRSRSSDFKAGPGVVYDYVPVVAKKAFVIEQDHNHFKCTFEGCNKAFRKEKLLESHIKYYHTDKGTATPGTRKRRKTTSICSTDSESSSAHSTPCSKKRHLSAEIAPPVCIPSPTVSNTNTIEVVPVKTEVDQTFVAEVKNVEQPKARTYSQDTAFTEAESTEAFEDELSKDEVVNCICLYNEENGLMVQCEVCLCWQHAACFDLTSESIEKKYVCYVCSDPAGVRDSRRYIYEQDWWKTGQMATFEFLSCKAQDEKKSKTIQATHDLVADTENIQAVLHGLKRKIKISKNKDHPEFKLWQTNLDLISPTKPEDSMSSEESTVTANSDNNCSGTSDDFEIHSSVENAAHIQSLLTKESALYHANHKNKPNCPALLRLKLHNSASSQSLSSTDSECKASQLVRRPADGGQESGGGAADQSMDDSTTDPNNTDIDLEVAGSSVDDMAGAYSPQPSTSSAPDTQYPGPSGDVKYLTEEDIAKNCHTANTVTVEENPFEKCEQNLLEHIDRVQNQIDQKLDLLEQQVTALENAESSNYGQTVDVLADLPGLKKSLRILQTDLAKVKRLAAFHR